MPSRIVAFADEPVVQAGLQAWLASDPEFELCCVSSTQSELLSAAARHQPNVILHAVAHDTDLDIVRELRRLVPKAALVLWSREFQPELAHRVVDMGVQGLLSTTATPETLKECLRVAAGGEMWMERSLSASLLTARPIRLSRRQSQLVKLLVQGLKNKEIAAALGITEGTVKSYLTTLFEKVGAKDRFELALFGLRNLKHLREMDELPGPGPWRNPIRLDPEGHPPRSAGARSARRNIVA